MLLVATMFCLAMLGRKVQASDRLTEHQLQIAQSAQSIEGQKLPERVSGYFRLDRECVSCAQDNNTFRKRTLAHHHLHTVHMVVK
jgi:hypothetical protein